MFPVAQFIRLLKNSIAELYEEEKQKKKKRKPSGG